MYKCGEKVGEWETERKKERKFICNAPNTPCIILSIFVIHNNKELMQMLKFRQLHLRVVKCLPVSNLIHLATRQEGIHQAFILLVKLLAYFDKYCFIYPLNQLQVANPQKKDTSSFTSNTLLISNSILL